MIASPSSCFFTIRHPARWKLVRNIPSHAESKLPFPYTSGMLIATLSTQGIPAAQFWNPCWDSWNVIF